MNHKIEHGPSFSWLRVELQPGEEVQAEAGSMVQRDTQVEMTTHLNTGKKAGFFRKLFAIFVAFMRKFIGGETMFVNRFTTPAQGEVVFAPALSGHIMHKKLGASSKLFVQTGSYLASTGDIDTKVRFTGLRSLLGDEGLVLLECTGQGDLFINSYGGVLPVQVNGAFTVDTGHIVAFEGNMNFKVKSVGGFKSLLFSGEGLVCEFSGQGTIYVQSRNLGALAAWLTPLLPA